MVETSSERAHFLSQKSNVNRFRDAYDQVAVFEWLNGGRYIGIKLFNLDGRDPDNTSTSRSGSVRAGDALGTEEGLKRLTYFEYTRTGEVITNDRIVVLSDGETVWTSRFKTTTIYDPSNNTYNPMFIRNRGNSNWYIRRDIDTDKVLIPSYVGQALEVIEYAQD